MTGGVLREEGIIFGRRKHFGEGESSGFGGLDFLVLSWSSAVWEDHYGGHRFAGGFGHGGQDSLTVSWS
jgi:hypothetical protein